MKSETKTVFYADDGVMYDNEEAAKKADVEFAKAQERTTYWYVRHKPDLTEGRGWYGALYLKVYIDSEWADHRLHVDDWCFRAMGSPLAFVQGCSPMANWCVHESDHSCWTEHGKARVGDYSYEGKQVVLTVDSKTHVLVADRPLKDIL